MSKKNRSESSVTAQRPLSQKTNKEDLTSIKSIAPIRKDVNTNTKYSIQESEKNSGSFNLDNKGRTLSKEQQEYFKDSKVRDKNGNLKTMYHEIDISTILNYKCQDFSVDKEDDGTVKGKTISGSSSKKIINYLVNSNGIVKTICRCLQLIIL